MNTSSFHLGFLPFVFDSYRVKHEVKKLEKAAEETRVDEYYSTKPIINSDFEEVLTKLRNVGNINAGGCGIATLAMYRWLKLNSPETLKDISIVYAYRYDHKKIVTNQLRISSNCMNLEVPEHVFMKWNDKYFDCEGEVDIQTYTNFHFVPSEEFLLETINNPSTDGTPWFKNWNPAFRRRNVRVIEVSLNVNLSDVIGLGR